MTSNLVSFEQWHAKHGPSTAPDYVEQQRAGWDAATSYMTAEIERLKTALRTVGDDYPGSSCQTWCHQQADGGLSVETACSAADYEEVLADHRRLVRELDVLLNGEHGAAKQASLCDIVSQLKRQTSDVPAIPIAGDAEARFMLWLLKEMPGGTVIGAPSWWSPRIFKAVLRAIELQEQVRPSPVDSTAEPT